MYFIGIDIGTGSTKAVAVDSSGKILASSQVAYPTLTPSPGTSEQVPEIIWQAFLKCIFRITSTLTETPSCVCLSSAMHSLIPVDDTGVPLGNMITWADNRSSDIATKLKNTKRGKKIYEETGTPVHSMSPLCKIAWLKEFNHDLFTSTKKFISIKEYIWFKLFDIYEIDYSIASATGLFDIQLLSWHTDALDFAGITAEHLSKPVNTTFVRIGFKSELSASLKLNTDTPFLIGASDGCLANVGSYATEPGVAALTIGTSGAIRVAGKIPSVNHTYMPFNYRLDEKTFISGGPINNGGVALKWYAQNLLNRVLTKQEDYDLLLDRITTVEPGCQGLLFLPYILGERAPIWNSEACGVFFGITNTHRQEHFTRAVIEGICFSLYHIATGIEAGGQEIKQVHISGGFVRSRHWIQLLCNIFGKKLILVNNEDASAIGATILGMKALGIRDSYLTPDHAEEHIFIPDETIHARYKNHFFPMYEHLYRTLALDMQVHHEQKTELTSQ